MLTVAVLLVAGGVAAAGWLIWQFVHAPVATFDEHAATACALLDPDHPDLPEPTPFADEVEAWLATEHTQEQP